jgi:hypothetical protein
MPLFFVFLWLLMKGYSESRWMPVLPAPTGMDLQALVVVRFVVTVGLRL